MGKIVPKLETIKAAQADIAQITADRRNAILRLDINEAKRLDDMLVRRTANLRRMEGRYKAANPVPNERPIQMEN